MEHLYLLSDFDGTMTNHDFYQILIDRHLGEWSKAQWQRGKLKDIYFLAIDLIRGKIRK